MRRIITFISLAAVTSWVALLTIPANAEAQSLPPPQILGHSETLVRDVVSGELHKPRTATGIGTSAAGTIHSSVSLVQVACSVAAPDGTQVRGLAQRNFHLYENGVPQEIAAFDASTAPANIALILDASPSIFRELGEMRGAARTLAANLSPADEIAVVSFSAETHLLLPFSTSRSLLNRALASKDLARVEDSSESKIYQSLFFTARELFVGRTGRKVIVLLTDGQDSGLGLTWSAATTQPMSGSFASKLAFDDVARELGSDGIALFIVSTENRPRAMTAAWLDAHQGQMLVTPQAHSQGLPLYTLYLAEMARRLGGQLDFLRETGSLDEIYRRIALAISAQYTLGYYPSAGTANPGWRSLRVELARDAKAPAGSKPIHRGSYYVSAFQ